MRFIGNGGQYRESVSQKISWGHWFAFFNVLWAIVIGSRYAFIIDWPHSLFGKLYFFISILGHFSFVAFAFYLLIIFPLSFLIKNERTFRGISVIITTVLLTLLLLDTEVFSRFNLHLSSVVWNLLVNPDNGELSRDWQIFFAPMPLLLLVQMLYSRWSWYRLRSLERQKWLRGVGVFFVTMFIATHLIYAWADAYIYRPITMQKSNFPLSYPMTARTFLEKNGLLDKDEYAQTLAQEGRPDALNIEYPKHPLQFAAMPQRPNILLITLSGLRADVVNRENMPNLSAFADNAARFTNHYSTGYTDNSGLSGLFYGLNANYTDSLLNDKKASPLIEKLRSEGYAFGLFSADNFKASMLRQAVFQGMGLPKRKTGNENALDAWMNWLQHRDQHQPWFGFLDLDLVEQVRNFKDKKPEQEKEFYFARLAELDRRLGQLFEQLHDLDPEDNTIVLISAERGYRFGAAENITEGYFGREEIQVPLIIRWDKLGRQISDKLTSHTDVLPTLIQSVFQGQNPVSDYAQGENLQNPLRQSDWVLVADYRTNVIITPEGTQYHLDKKGQYRKYDSNYQPQSSERPPLGLFLEAFTQSRSFIAN
ncbi:hypothetical protein EDC45_0169 [Mesocricetibacter intestinalis]|uniref:Inner membrane protein YejM n=1 Tax=Mesocricetibacter intestinalis TaxID=1521930 RepID=A0A4R6VFH3_9PAST|nr:DUF3413 domain-containing protein [Mesocricetibacter intestinalis]TDQ59519.1 hypothetical protein EDC45_0169 [Mesocricetibacter intestinalis]